MTIASTMLYSFQPPCVYFIATSDGFYTDGEYLQQFYTDGKLNLRIVATVGLPNLV